MNAEDVLARTELSKRTFRQLVNPLTVGFGLLNLSFYVTLHGMNYHVTSRCIGSGLLILWVFDDCYILIPDQRFLMASLGIIFSIGLMMWYIRNHQRWALPVGVYLISVYPGHIFKATADNIASVCSYPECNQWIFEQYERHHLFALFCIYLGMTLIIYYFRYVYYQRKAVNKPA